MKQSMALQHQMKKYGACEPAGFDLDIKVKMAHRKIQLGDSSNTSEVNSL